FHLGDKDFRLPGIGSYMSVAVEQGRVDAMLWAVLAMIGMILTLDQFLWRPVVVWAQKFRVEEGGAHPVASSWFLTWLRRSQIRAALERGFQRLRAERIGRSPQALAPKREAHAASPWAPRLSLALFVLL